MAVLFLVLQELLSNTQASLKVLHGVASTSWPKDLEAFAQFPLRCIPTAGADQITQVSILGKNSCWPVTGAE